MVDQSTLRLEGQYENERNSKNSCLYKDIIREAKGVTDVICGHHLVYVTEDKRDDGFTYQVIEEIPAADTLIFDHEIAYSIWGDYYKDVLCKLACEPCESRDELLHKLYYGRVNISVKIKA